MSLRDARDHRSDRVWIERVYRDYRDDLGLLNTGVFPALGEIGHREPDQVQNWVGDPSATLITILDSMSPVGFALVARRTHAARVADFRMADSFIAREVRAVEFWRKVIATYTKGDYQERVANGEVRQTFRSGRSVPAT